MITVDDLIHEFNNRNHDFCYSDVVDISDYGYVYIGKLIDSGIKQCIRAFKNNNKYCEVVCEKIIVGYRITENNVLNTYIYYVHVSSKNYIRYED